MERTTPVAFRGVRTGAHELEYDRFERVMIAIARGLQFHSFGLRHEGDLWLIAGDGPFASFQGDAEVRRLAGVMTTAFARGKMDGSVLEGGQNADTFQYWLVKPDGSSDLAARLKFYGEIELFVVTPANPVANVAEPQHE